MIVARPYTMRAAVLRTTGSVAASDRLAIEERDVRDPGPGEVLLRVAACGVCRTDLHIVAGELVSHRDAIVPGHQIVGTIVRVGASVTLAMGLRVGVSWLAGTDGTCGYCRDGRENLCDAATFTGYDRDGGFATYALARADFVFPLPPALGDLQAAPLLCAGIIGFRALRVAGVRRNEHVGLYGFGSSAHLALPVLKAWGCTVSVVTRGDEHRAFALRSGADWVGAEDERPPKPLDRAVTFAPSGNVVVAALGALRKGGVVAINAVHLDRVPQFDYDALLWGERQLRSVTNMTRDDARDFLALATELDLRPTTTVFPLERANDALRAVASDAIDGAVVVSVANSEAP